MTAAQLIQHLDLQPHPEGGFYREVYRSAGTISSSCLPSTFDGERNFSTSIYYLLQKGDYSAFHRIRSDEIWHFYTGGSLLLHLIDEAGIYHCLRLGNKLAEGDTFQVVMPARVWFAAEPATGTDYTLAGCTVSPGFDFLDFEMAEKNLMERQFPHLNEIVHRLCR
jgi:predicted cupin superfamily sugar epimerase